MAGLGSMPQSQRTAIAFVLGAVVVCGALVAVTLVANRDVTAPVAAASAAEAPATGPGGTASPERASATGSGDEGSETGSADRTLAEWQAGQEAATAPKAPETDGFAAAGRPAEPEDQVVGQGYLGSGGGEQADLNDSTNATPVPGSGPADAGYDGAGFSDGSS